MALAAMPDVMLVRARISEPARYYDSERTIVVRKDLLVEDERRYLWHELVHATRRDVACYTDQKVEVSVDREAARRAMPMCSLLEAWPRAADWDELADLLKVPVVWARWRVQIAHPAEKGALRRLREAHAC